ncbi:hypothetical protein XU18_0567 [Perkinsela sp. CCAP 1560/4]|nr:hypothetical protein XU18_0567 [Perkinsela sp. CCAP 1560/4]|eukprot:KNH09289.1 hypothetical protein XU18_0567 [Perkinsela sp. CCAP 1560/4]
MKITELPVESTFYEDSSDAGSSSDNEFLSYFDVLSPLINSNFFPSGESDDQPYDDEHKGFLAQRWESRQLATLADQAYANEQNRSLVIWKRRNTGNSWVLVCPTRLKQGVLDPEVKCKAQVSLAFSRKKSHADLPYYIRRNSTHLAHAECGGFRTAKGAHILKNVTFQALIAENKKASAATMVTIMRLATRKDKIRAKGYTFQRCRRSLISDDIKSESLRCQLIQPLRKAWSALPENGHAEMRSLNGEFEMGGAVYAAGLYACMQGMNVSFLDMSHSHSNLYHGVHVILCGQDRGGSVTIVAHALVARRPESTMTRPSRYSARIGTAWAHQC